MPDEINWKQKLENLKTDKIKFAVTDIDGVLRGKIISKAKLLKGLDEGLRFCNVVFGWDINDVVYDTTRVSGWHTGYPDAVVTVDVNTGRNIPWDDNTPFFLADFSNSEEVRTACPRTLLKQIRLKCTDRGFNPQFATEYEWFNFKETPQSFKDKNYLNPQPFTTGMFGYSMLRLSQNKEFYNDLFTLLQQFNIPLEALHTETGDGVCEAAINYTDILEAADRAVLFKSSVKEIASGHQLIASFMAKWSSDFPGCSGHIHQSLWDGKKNTNLFFDENNENQMSELLKQYVAGQLYCLPHILPMYAPTVNSYKRYVEGAWAATSVSWGIENRTTALRVINQNSSSMRLETRVPGADANPYLSLAASLASGLYGIENKLSLDIAATKGDEYTNEASRKFPKTLKEATDAMKASNIPKELFGADFVDHFIKTREWEWNEFNQKVTDWELKRYFEII
jgi:glutamine synthetase